MDTLKVKEDFQTWVKGCLTNESEDVCVTFTKKDGSERVLRGTLAESRIPADKRPKAEGNTSTADSQKIFDLDIGEWRSFRWDTVKNIDVKEAT